ncbi:Ketopantoate reductase ApbA/PanE [Penicillium alfredii]|uniref:2-dehydropantoate 2-reductase n=1 Tax=Penicillium alfredii TaxID=1506179 RepID=A0A9W9KR28_9EURO|nr:Ketopantoate reductase ApbA/PanE [Penicillium alfredii]KAJ5114688.1 Ketopantoate reductase ApbA/PanE [Penicillium alfredii]
MGGVTRYLSTWMQDVDDVSRETKTPRLSGRVHILGMGNVGTFVAHSLAARQSPPPITLLLHKPEFYEEFRKKKECLVVNTNGLDDIKSGFDVNVLDNGVWYSPPSSRDMTDRAASEQGPAELQETAQAQEDEEPIECLIVCTKANVTQAAVRTVSHRLTPNSTVLLIQNGMGVFDEINRWIFPDPKKRPHYMMGIFSHGLTKKSTLHVSHMGVGTTILSPMVANNTPVAAAENDTHWAATTKYLLRLMTLTPPLVAVAETPAGLLQYQLEKLAVNSIINPLTALSGCANGELLYIFSYTRVIRLLLFEISAVICALPELQGIPGVEDRFAPERLRRRVVNVAYTTAKNRSSMLQDFQSKKATEIDYFNGYIVRRGEELGIKCVLNYMIKHLVNSQLAVLRRREDSAIPIDIDNIVLHNLEGEEELGQLEGEEFLQDETQEHNKESSQGRIPQ